ncbi:hypothetical protein VQ056_16260 [Paenibacillus sp. JTLBN-2024]
MRPGNANTNTPGANRLGANSLVSAIFGGMVAGPKAVEYIKGLKKSAADVSSTVFDQYKKKQEDKYENIHQDGRKRKRLCAA